MNPKYNQLENEDSYEYGLRLIETKIEQNPPDLEWSDIVDLLGLVKSHILESWIRRCLSSKKNAKDFSIKEQRSTR